MVQQGGEPQLPVSFCCSAHTVQPAWPAFPTRCSAQVRLVHVLLGQRSFLHTLRRQYTPLFGCFAGTTPLYDSPSPYTWGLWLIAFPHRPATFRLRAATGPLGSRTWSFYTCVGSSTPRERGALALSHTAILPSGWGDTVGFPHFRFRSSIPSLYIVGIELRRASCR